MKIIKQFLHFAAVGLVGTAAQYIALVGLVSAFSMNAVFASSLGYILGALVNYQLNFRFTFNSNKKHSDTLPKFLSVAAFGFMLNGLLIAVFIERFLFHYLVSQILATGIVLLWNYGANKAWTFREQHASSSNEN